MAERNQLKIADRHGIADDDPFAELTRIMGFDPREPARPQAVEPELSASPEGGAHDDFDIDLEKELMGDFSLEGEEAEPASAFAELPSPEQSAISAEEDEARSFADADQPAFDDGMDDAVAASLDEDVAVEQAAVEQAIVESPRWDDEPAYEETAYDEPAYEPAHAVSDEARRSAPEAGVAETNDAETDVAAALEGTWFEPVLDDEDQFAAEDGAEALAGSGEGDADEPAFDTNAFDAAIAAEPDDRLTTVHMSDDAQEDLAYNPDAVAAHDFFEEAGSYEPASYELASYQASEDHEADALAAPATGTGDLEDHFDAAMADVDMDFEAREADVPGFAAPDAPVFAAGEEAASEDIAFDEDFASTDFDEPVQAAAATQAHPARVETPASAPAGDTSLEDELNALLARMTTRPAITEQPAWPLATPVAGGEQYTPAPQPAAAEPHPAEDDLHAMLAADLDAMDFDETPQAAADFDAEAFHAALHGPDEPQVEESVSVPHEEPSRFSQVAAASAAAFASAVAAKSGRAAPPADAPEIETVDVPERAVALADDLDIPDVPFEEPAGDNAMFDDLENEFAGLLGQMNDAPAPTHAAYRDDAYGVGFSRGAMQAQAGSENAFRQPVAPSAQAAFHPAAAGFAADEIASGGSAQENDPFAVDDLAYDPDDTVALSGMADDEQARQPRRGLLIAGIVCAVAVAGGLGALAFSFGGGGSSDAPALVKADNQPIKVKPENPGGTVIPNQNNKVYDAMAKGIQPAAPSQPKLVTSNEDPVDVNAAAPQSRVVDLSGSQDEATVGKSEDRIAPTAQDDSQTAAADVPVVTPRKVRTMIVKPDGSLVPREDPTPQVAASEPADPAPQHVGANDQTGTVATADAGESALKPANAGADVTTPKMAPIAPQRPSDQPVDVVGEVKPDQVASLDTTASTAPAGEWSMQIASQPTAESAQSTYNDLSRRYGSVLGGHGVNIVKADIAGKGTFYRVRVPTQSRNDAIKLCESYKAAGGNCFVSK